MSSGQVHDGATVFGAVVVGLAMHQSPITQSYAVATAIGILVGGSLISPDMDVSNGRGSKSLNRWRLGKGRLSLDLRILWKPYQWIAPHRSWVSHSPIVGSLGRFLYVCLITLGVLPYAMITGLGVPTTVALLIGNEIGAGLHLLADGLWWNFYLPACALAVGAVLFLEWWFVTPG